MVVGRKSGKAPTPPAIRFMRHVEERAGHWFWTGWTDERNPCGQFAYDGHRKITTRQSSWLLFRDAYPPGPLTSLCGEQDCIHPQHIGCDHVTAYPPNRKVCRGCRAGVTTVDEGGRAMLIVVCQCGWCLRGHHKRKCSEATLAAYEKHRANCAAEYNAYQARLNAMRKARTA